MYLLHDKKMVKFLPMSLSQECTWYLHQPRTSLNKVVLVLTTEADACKLVPV